MALTVTVQHLAAGRHQLHAADVGRVGLKVFTGAVSRGGNRAGEGLIVDIGHVLQRLADILQWHAHARHRCAGGEFGLQDFRVVIKQPREVAQRQQCAVGGHQGAERMR